MQASTFLHEDFSWGTKRIQLKSYKCSVFTLSLKMLV
jgi:hypothetical protein